MKYVRLGSSGLKVSHVCLGVKRNVVELAEVPTGRDGRTSKSLTPEQVDAVLTATAPHRMHNYIVLSLLTGARTEELRALHWTMCTSATRLMGNHRCPRTSRCGDQCGRAGDTKTRRSRRTLALPARCVDALRNQRDRQYAERAKVGAEWQETGLVFPSSVGTPMSAGKCPA